MNSQSLNNSAGKIKGLAYYLIIGLVIIGEFTAAFVFIPRFWADISNKEQGISDRQKEVGALERAVGVLEKNSSQSLDANLAKAEVALPGEKKVSGLISGLTLLGTASGVLVKSISFSPGNISTMSALTSPNPASGQPDQETSLGQGVKGVEMSVSIQGNNQNLLEFISKLQKVSQLLGIESINISSSGDIQNAQLSILVYYQPTANSKIELGKITPFPAEGQKTLESLSGEDIFVIPPGGR